MTFTDYAPQMEPEPIVQILRRFLLLGRKLLSKPILNQGELRTWVAGVRLCLSRIYGKEAAQLAYFPQITDAFPLREIREELGRRMAHFERIVARLDDLPELTQTAVPGKRVFIGHGRSHMWRVLKDFIADELHLAWDEFNRETPAGYPTTERLGTMMSEAAFAFLIMTAEEDHGDSTVHARPNVIHEVGLFQGCLGFSRAIVMLEHGCTEFSNIVGLSQIRFPQGDISARLEEVRRVLKREGLISG